MAVELEHVPVWGGPDRGADMAKKAPRGDEADYVVVGSGSSGAAIAGRLAQAGASVIVLEAGKSDEQLLIKKPGLVGPMHAVPQLKKPVDWGYYSACRRNTFSIAGCRCRAARWSAAPARSTAWSTSAATAPTSTPGPPRATPAGTPTASTRAYKRMEDFEDGENAFRGAGGPIRVTRSKHPAGRLAAVRRGHRRRARLPDPRRLQRRVARRRQPDAAERRRRPALQRLARLPPPPRPADAGTPVPGAGDAR